MGCAAEPQKNGAERFLCTGPVERLEVGPAEGSREVQVRVPFSAVPREDDGPERRAGRPWASEVGL